MIEKGKISALQMGMMIYSAIIATGILFLPNNMFNYAGRDMWISPIWSSVIGFVTVFVAVRLNKLYPKDTIIQYSEHIMGVFLGKVIGIILLFFYLQAVSHIVWQYGEFVMGYFLPHTPQVVVLGSMILICAFAVRGGVEVVGRLAEMIVPIFILLFLFIIILLLPDAEVKNIFPIMGKGVIPSFKGAILPNVWFSQLFFLSFFLPYVTDRQKGARWGGILVCTVMLTMVITNLIILFIFGAATGNMGAPLMNAVQYISVADFLSHLEALVMAIWIAGAFIKINVFYYVLALGSAQWLNLSEYRTLVLPLGFLIVLLAIWDTPNASAYASYVQKISLSFGPLSQTLLPLFLLLIAYLRKGKHRKKEELKG
ncbi:spore germination protein [Ectobacillus funiculus]|uniref:GerAB/ArcD/ProY family transporter n=1 Tax=Ectobacillus funiculus TaxID=137993 RepID=UPI00397C2D14